MSFPFGYLAVIERLLLVSTCGTSLLTNGATEDDRRWLTRIANDVEVDRARLTPIVNDRRLRLEKADEAARRKMSAELNGIGAVLARYEPKQIFHLLVHTDTALGKVTAELVQQSLGNDTALVSAGGLRTNDFASFRVALADLTRQLDELVESYRERGWFVVFNLTGGFKSLNGYLQTLAMISAHRCVFLFEGASDLMEIPRLPVRLAEIEELREHAIVFRRLAMDYRVRPEDTKSVPDSLLMEVDGEVSTSVLGDVVWARHRAALFAEKLLPTLSRRVRVVPSIQKAFAKLEAAQKVQVNEAIDEFCAYLDHGRSLPKSRSFKKLQGDPMPGSTHELYVWSDGATGRLYGHFDATGIFFFDRLEGHLP